MSEATLLKLGWRPGARVHVLGRPDGLSVIPDEQATDPNLILAFVRTIAEVMPMLAQALPLYQRGGRLWFAYPKKTGRIRTDINRDHGWSPLAEAGMLAVTQVAIDTTWSALCFRYRDEITTLTRRSERA